MTFGPLSISPMSRGRPQLSEDAKGHANRGHSDKFKSLSLGEIQAGGDTLSEPRENMGSELLKVGQQRLVSHSYFDILSGRVY